MKVKLLISTALAFFLLAGMTTLAWSQTEPPPPYSGLTNPFPWADARAQEAGKTVYQQNCVGCHGANGSSLPQFDFSASDFPQKLEARPDYYFWIVSEGRISQGMPGYKATLSEEQRWQVLNYMWSLSAAPPPASPTPTAPPVEGVSVTLTAPPPASTGQELTLTAALADAQNKPVKGAEVHFFVEEQFFAKGPMEIGQAATNEQGVAAFRYIPRRAAETNLVARYGTNEAKARLTITDSGETFYRTEAGIELPSLGPPVFVGPESSKELGEMGEAPLPALRLPGGILSWLWLYVAIILLVWGTYLFTMYQALRISSSREIGTNRMRLVPVVGLFVIIGLGLVMVLMIITGSFAHFHLPH